MLPTKFRFIWLSSFKGEDFLEINQNVKSKRMTDDRRRTPSDGKSSYCLWQGLLKRILKYKYLLVMYRIKCYTISALVNF
jgi:hypothetical protein